MLRWAKVIFSDAFLLCENLWKTNQEDGQLELVVEYHGMNAAGSREPGCYFIQEIGVKDEEEDARA